MASLFFIRLHSHGVWTCLWNILVSPRLQQNLTSVFCSSTPGRLIGSVYMCRGTTLGCIKQRHDTEAVQKMQALSCVSPVLSKANVYEALTFLSSNSVCKWQVKVTSRCVGIILQQWKGKEKVLPKQLELIAQWDESPEISVRSSTGNGRRELWAQESSNGRV